MQTWSARVAIALTVVALAACRSIEPAAPPTTSTPTPAPPPPESLAGTSWLVRTLDGVAADDQRSTLEFVDERRVAGDSGCNRYGASYSADALGLRITSLASTRKLCDSAQMAREQRFQSVLAAVRGLRFDATGSLLLLDEAGTIRATLVRTPPH